MHPIDLLWVIPSMLGIVAGALLIAHWLKLEDTP